MIHESSSPSPSPPTVAFWTLNLTLWRSRTAKWAKVESCEAECSWMRMKIQRRFQLTVRSFWDAPSIRAVWKFEVCISKSKRSIVPTNVLGKGHPSPVQNCMISFENKSHERRLEPISSRVLKSFQLKKIHDFQRCSGGIRHTQVGQGDAKKPRWTAPAEARRPTFHLGHCIGENPTKIWWIFDISPLFGAFFSGVPRRNGHCLMVQNGGSRKSFWEAIATGKLLWMISLRSTRPCESGCSRWGYLIVFFLGGTWRPKFRPTQVLTWMAFSWFTSSHSTAVSSAWIQYVLPGLMSRHKNHHGLVLKDMWHLSFRFPLRLYGKWTIVCKLAFVNKEFTYCSLLYTSSPDFHAFTFHWCGFDSLGMSR